MKQRRRNVTEHKIAFCHFIPTIRELLFTELYAFYTFLQFHTQTSTPLPVTKEMYKKKEREIYIYKCSSKTSSFSSFSPQSHGKFHAEL
jgi:hypothetical protein